MIIIITFTFYAYLNTVLRKENGYQQHNTFIITMILFSEVHLYHS